MSEKMKEKVSAGNNHADFALEVIRSCLKHGVVFWLENPDTSFLWLQKGFEKYADPNSPDVFCLEYCRTPVRRRQSVFLLDEVFRDICPGFYALQQIRDLAQALYSSFSQERFEVQLQLQLLPLQLLRGRRKLQIGELSGIKMPQEIPLFCGLLETFGHVVLKLKLTLKQSPAKLFLSPLSVPREMVESKGHVSDPFSVIKACGLAVARLQTALKMEPLKAALHEMRENMLLMIWWSTLMLLAPLWTGVKRQDLAFYLQHLPGDLRVVSGCGDIGTGKPGESPRTYQ
eukprot:s224_g14.t1